MSLKIGIVGGGISGLLAAYFLKQKGHDVVLWEASSRVGGWIKSERRDTRLLEWGPQTLLANASYEKLFRELQLNPVSSSALNRRRYIWRNSRKHPLPTGPLEFLKSNLFRVDTKWRILTEAFRTTKIAEDDLSIAKFGARIWNEDFVDYAFDPFVSGIFAGDVARLSTPACFPKLWKLAKERGSVTRGFLLQKKSARPKMLSFREGLEEIPKALAARLAAKIHLNQKVESVERIGEKWLVKSGDSRTQVDRLVIASPSFQVASLLKEILPPIAVRILTHIPYQSVSVWQTVFKKPGSFQSGFGCLIPSVYEQSLRGSLWGSEIFGGRCSSDELISTQYLTEDANPEDSLSFLQKVLGIETAPVFSESKSYANAIPQFVMGHKTRIETLRKSLPSSISLVGNYLDGVGLPAAMDSAEKLASTI